MSVLIGSVMRKRTEHQEPGEIVVGERGQFAQHRRIIEAQLGRGLFLPSEHFVDRPLVLRRDAMEEFLDGLVQVRAIQRPRPGLDRFDHHALANDLVHLDVEEFLLPAIAVLRRRVA